MLMFISFPVIVSEWVELSGQILPARSSLVPSQTINSIYGEVFLPRYIFLYRQPSVIGFHIYSLPRLNAVSSTKLDIERSLCYFFRNHKSAKP